MPYSQLVVLPYQTLLHESTRLASGIDIRESVIIIDEAHNLVEAINSMYSCLVSRLGLLLFSVDFSGLKGRSGGGMVLLPSGLTPKGATQSGLHGVLITISKVHAPLANAVVSCIWIFILLSRESDQSAITSSLRSCQPSVYHTKMGKSR